MNRPTPPPGLDDEELPFLRWLLQQAGLSVNHYRPESLARRMPACLRVLRAGSVAQARAVVERNPKLVHAALNALIIGVTSFFRDAAVFDALQRQVLPRIGQRPGCRIWSVGCSDGCELYSVAMQLAGQQMLHRCHLLGTDCRAEAVLRAQTARYSTTRVNELPARLREAYFAPAAEGVYAIRPALRGATQWRIADAMRADEPGLWDLILCRNMAIYMTGDAVAELWRRLSAALRPGGYLVLGKAEHPYGCAGLESAGPCIYRQKG